MKTLTITLTIVKVYSDKIVYKGYKMVVVIIVVVVVVVVVYLSENLSVEIVVKCLLVTTPKRLSGTTHK